MASPAKFAGTSGQNTDRARRRPLWRPLLFSIAFRGQTLLLPLFISLPFGVCVFNLVRQVGTTNPAPFFFSFGMI